jgi:hypothetical protein
MPGPEKRVDFSQLVNWMEGCLPEEEARAVEERVARADSATLADLAWLGQFFKAVEGAVLESPPPDVRDALIARFAAYAEGRRAPAILRRAVATLTFDGGLRPAVGVRAAGAQEARRQRIYSTDEFDVALNFWQRARDKNLDLHGQVFPREEVEIGALSVQLLREETELAITTADDLSAFAFVSIPPGVYKMILSTDWIEVSVTPIEVSV